MGLENPTLSPCAERLDVRIRRGDSAGSVAGISGVADRSSGDRDVNDTWLMFLCFVI